MRWGAAAIVAVSMACVLAGCGFSSEGRNVEEALVAAEAHVENARAKLLLAEAEDAKFDIEADQGDEAKGRPGEVSEWTIFDHRSIRRDLREGHEILGRCKAFPGSGSCSELGKIEAVVKEMGGLIAEPITDR
jgi:hypothetical protein